MKEMLIKYNPYRLETAIQVDGDAPQQKSKLNFADRRLQEWVEELPEIIFEEYRTRQFKITFHGTILDFEDVEAMAREARKDGFNIELEHIPAKEVADKENAISEIFDEIQRGPFDELKQPDVVKAFNMAKSSDFEVNVVATMSAGKSTLINSLLRQKLMPAKQEACTATITEIKDTDSECFTAKVYDANGSLIQIQPELTFEIMEKLNSDPSVSKIRAEGNIPFVSSEDVSLVLVDTPGPNNSRDPEHRAATYRMLSESSKAVVLYILNATQLAVNDDYNLLSHVADSMRVGGKQSRDRFIFVVNKLDEFKKGEDSVDAAITKVRDYLKDNGIENANIYPASALTALNIRTILAESDDDNDDDVYEAKGKVRKFNKNPEMHFETKAPLTPSVRGQLERRLSEAQNSGDAKSEALIHCGIVPIEMAIQMYVRKYAKTAKVRNIVDTFSKRLESAKSFETTKQEIAENQDKHREILATIEVIERKLSSGEEAKLFKTRIDKINYDTEIKKLANEKVKEAQEKITGQLSSAEERMNKKDAEEVCKRFAKFAENLRAEIQVKLEELITNHVTKNANDLLEEYRKRLAELSADVSTSGIPINPFEIMEGSIEGLSNIGAIMEAAEKKEKNWEVVGSHKEYKEVLGFRRWLNRNLGTNFDVKYDVVDDYDWVEHTYIDGTVLANRFFAPVEEGLYEYRNAAVAYAKSQAQKVQDEFKKKFNELNEVLKQKLNELKDYTKDSKDVEAKIKESQHKLKWLEDIQAKTKAILDI